MTTAPDAQRAGPRETVRNVDTLVVGGGIAGLAYAHALGDSADVVLLEASDRLGGLIRTGTWEDVHYECGPEALQDNAPETVALFDELGLERSDADAAAKRRYIHTARGLVEVPTGPGAFLRSPLLSWPGKLRVFAEPWRAATVGLDGSIADFVRHRLGPQALDRLVDPAIAGIYAGDPERLSLRAAFPAAWELVSEHGSLIRGMIAKLKQRKREREAAAEQARARGEPPPVVAKRRPPSLMSVAGGLERLPEALGAALGERVHRATPVQSVRWTGNGGDVRWLVECGSAAAGSGSGSATGSGATPPPTSWSARRLVLALPAAHAAALLRENEPELSQQLGSMVSEAMVSVATVWPREAVRHPLDGFGYLVPSQSGMTHLGTLFSSTLQPARCPGGRVLIRTLMGGARRPDLLDETDDALLEIIGKEVGGVLGLSGEPTFAHVTRLPVALPRYDLDQVMRQATIDEFLAERPGLSIIGNHRRGISVNALIEASRTQAREHTTAHA